LRPPPQEGIKTPPQDDWAGRDAAGNVRSLPISACEAHGPSSWVQPRPEAGGPLLGGLTGVRRLVTAAS